MIQNKLQPNSAFQYLANRKTPDNWFLQVKSDFLIKGVKVNNKEAIKFFTKPCLKPFNIFPEEKIIYFKIARTAGTSLLRTQFQDKFQFDTLNNRDNLKELFNWCLKIDFNEIEKNYKTFAFVRNPYERVLSLYLYFKKIKVIQEETFDSFLKKIPLRCCSIPEFYMHAAPMSDFLVFKDKIIPKMVLHVESFEADSVRLFEYLNIPYAKIPKVNYTNKEEGVEYFTEDVIKSINDIYYNDFKYFKYPLMDSNSKMFGF